jgi:hypothetical protein
MDEYNFIQTIKYILCKGYKLNKTKTEKLRKFLDTHYNKIKIYSKNPGDGNNVLNQAVPVKNNEKQVDKLDRTKAEEGGPQPENKKGEYITIEFTAKIQKELTDELNKKAVKSKGPLGVEKENLMSQIREEYNEEMEKYEKIYERRMEYKRKIEKRINELYSVITAKKSAPRIIFKQKDVSGININWNIIMNSAEYKEMNFIKIIEKFEEPILTTFLSSDNVPLCVKFAVFYVVQNLIDTENEKIRYHPDINRVLTEIVVKCDFTLFEGRIKAEKELEEKLKNPEFANSETTKLLLKKREEEAEKATSYYINKNRNQMEYTDNNDTTDYTDNNDIEEEDDLA